jgi:signal transduction histidine kinase
MKKQRTSNPRFLGALGFLGFLGCLGSQNPEITRWAWLSLVSLSSLLVLLPTQVAENATYTLNPKRRWALLLLGFLGFLGFLGSGTPSLAGLACFSLFSQAAVIKGAMLQDVRKRMRRRGVLLGAVVGLLFGIFFITMPLIHPMLGILVPVLVTPSLLPFFPLIEGKEHYPLRDLMPIFLLLFAAIILPSVGLVWFMNQAMQNEQMAVRQRLSELYQAQLNAAAKQINTQISEHRETLGRHAALPPAERFDALVREQVGTGILILCGGGHRRIIYPADTLSAAGDSGIEAAALKIKVRHLIREGLFDEAAAELGQMMSVPKLRNARDEEGRLILPPLQLFFVQKASGDEAAGMLDSLRDTVIDYTLEIPSPRRIFYLQALTQLGADVHPWLGAELTAAELQEKFDTVRSLIPATSPVGLMVFSVEDGNVCLLENADSSAMAIIDFPRYVEEMQAVVNNAVTTPGIRIMIEKKGLQGEKKPRLVGASFGYDMVLNLYTEGDDPFAVHARHRRMIHLGIGVAMVCVMSVICGLLVRSLLAQQRLTKMKNDFVATVTHELKTPLASTRLFVDTLLEGRCRDDAQQREYLELIARENKRLSRLIDNFLTFSRMERNKRTFTFEDSDPGLIAEAAADAVRENYECTDCRLTVDIAENLPPILADKDAMVTVLLNLLDNACKYSEGEKRIALRVYEENAAVCFEVRDNGIGMARRELSKIMDRFYQIDQSMTRKVGGAGLGLSIVSFIVEAHRAAIEVESELGRGSAFIVKVPRNGGSHGG